MTDSQLTPAASAASPTRASSGPMPARPSRIPKSMTLIPSFTNAPRGLASRPLLRHRTSWSSLQVKLRPTVCQQRGGVRSRLQLRLTPMVDDYLVAHGQLAGPHHGKLGTESDAALGCPAVVSERADRFRT